MSQNCRTSNVTRFTISSRFKRIIELGTSNIKTNQPGMKERHRACKYQQQKEKDSGNERERKNEERGRNKDRVEKWPKWEREK